MGLRGGPPLSALLPHPWPAPVPPCCVDRSPRCALPQDRGACLRGSPQQGGSHLREAFCNPSPLKDSIQYISSYGHQTEVRSLRGLASLVQSPKFFRPSSAWRSAALNPEATEHDPVHQVAFLLIRRPRYPLTNFRACVAGCLTSHHSEMTFLHRSGHPVPALVGIRPSRLWSPPAGVRQTRARRSYRL